MPKNEPEVEIAKANAIVGEGESKYRPEYAEQAMHLCRLGATDHDLSEALHVAPRTIRNWQACHPEFRAALKIGKDEADARVERALYHRAVGYDYEAVKIFMPAGCDKPVYAKYTEHVPPDVTAQIFWLKNRKRETWRDGWQVEHNLGKYLISDKPMSEEEWIKQRAIDVTPKDKES